MTRSSSTTCVRSPTRDVMRGAAAPPRQLVERTRERVGAHRLDEVVERVDLERAQRVLVVRGREDDHRAGRQAARDREAVDLGHRDVEEHRGDVAR